MASEHSSSKPTLHEMTPATISSGLVPNPPPSKPFIPPTRTDWDLLFQPMFDELLNPPPSVDLPSPENHDLDVAHMNNDPFFGISISKNVSDASSSLDVTVVHTATPNSEHVNKWTKDHPLDNIINELKRPVSTRLQLLEHALFCYYNVFLSSVEPKTYKDALIQACWIKAMQEELNEFEHLEVWKLVPRPDKVMIITLKWIYKEFSKGTVDPTLFIRRQGKDILLISQSPRGIFLNKSKYALESLKKYGMESSDHVDTPMVEKSKLDEDPQVKAVDPTLYHGMVDTLMYLRASRPDLTFAVCMCVWGLWYPKDSSIALTAYADADHAACQDTRRSTSGKQVEKAVIELYFVNTEYQLADIFTKSLCRERIEFLINKLRMRSFTTKTLKQLADDAEE
nr:hypothetical protein [Tanacetum cinerariifolium]